MNCPGCELAMQVIFPACHIRATALEISRHLAEFGLNPGGYRVGQCVLPVAGGVQVDQRGTAARTALQTLEREGLVVVRPRRGRIVRSTQRLRWHLSEFEHPDHTVLTTSDAWETDIESQGHDPTRQDLQVEQITPPPGIAERLNLDPRTDVCVVRRHVRYMTADPPSSRTTTSTSASSAAPTWPSPRTPRGRTSSPKQATSRSTTPTRSSPACQRPRRSADSPSRLAHL